MKPFRIDFASLRKSENLISIAVFSFLGLGMSLGISMMGASAFLLGDPDTALSPALCLVAVALVGYTLVAGMLDGPEETVTVEAQENQKHTTGAGEKWYLKI